MSDRPGAVAVACGSEAEADGWAVRDLVIVKRALEHFAPPVAGGCEALATFAYDDDLERRALLTRLGFAIQGAGGWPGGRPIGHCDVKGRARSCLGAPHRGVQTARRTWRGVGDPGHGCDDPGVNTFYAVAGFMEARQGQWWRPRWRGHEATAPLG